ncbi:MAG: N-acetyltransferase [Chloroflexi bacterium]|nr:N-acetyltransferase [Chloroflexota bacterium]
MLEVRSSSTAVLSMSPVAIIIRRATLADAEQIAALVDLGVSEGQLLPRTPDEIRASIRDWVVAEQDARVIGIGALLEMSAMLAEVRSLVVAPEYRKFGVGARIVHALVEEARTRGIPTVFGLTRAVPFFERLGFAVTDKENFPEKVWRDCIVCPVRFDCDETAMVLEFRQAS